MSITIVPTVDDLIEYSIYESYRSPRARRNRRQRYLFVSVIGLALIAGIAWRLTQPGGIEALIPDLLPVESVLAAIAVVLIIWGLLWSFVGNTPPVLRRIICRRMQQFPQNYREALAPRELTICDRGTRTVGDGFQHVTPWKHVSNVVRDHDRAYILYATKRVEIVPADALPDGETVREYLEEIRRHRVAAVSEPPEEAAPDEKAGVRITPNADDIAALQDYFHKRVRSWGITQWIIVAGLISICFVLSFMGVVALLEGRSTPQFALILIVLFVVWVCVLAMCGIVLGGGSLFLRRHYLRYFIARNPARFQFYLLPARIVCDENGLRVFVDGIEEFSAWQRIPQVVEDIHTNRLFICTLYSTRDVHAVVVPRRAFDSEFAFADYCHNTVELWRNALASPRKGESRDSQIAPESKAV